MTVKLLGGGFVCVSICLYGGCPGVVQPSIAQWPGLSFIDLWNEHNEVWVTVTLTACDKPPSLKHICFRQSAIRIRVWICEAELFLVNLDPSTLCSRYSLSTPSAQYGPVIQRGDDSIELRKKTAVTLQGRLQSHRGYKIYFTVFIGFPHLSGYILGSYFR